MELAIQIQIEELPEGLYLATSEELPGLVAQGRTVAEALEIARDVARKLIEARRERDGVPNLPTTSERRDYTIGRVPVPGDRQEAEAVRLVRPSGRG
jgi:predicted RNase H-like HicB family nuclease